MVSQEMIDHQFLIEEEIRNDTIGRYMNDHQKAARIGAFGDTHVGRSLMDIIFNDFVSAVDTWAEGKRAGKAGRRPQVVSMIDEFGDTRTMCYIFLKHILHNVHLYQNYNRDGYARRSTVVLKSILAVHDELRIRYFRENFLPLMKRIAKDHEARALTRDRRRELWMREFKKKQIEWVCDGWDQTNRIKLGLTLLELLMSVTDVLVYQIDTVRGKKIAHLDINPARREEIEDKMMKAASFCTLFYPTVIPPKPWKNGSLIGGGYYTDNVQPYRLIKGASIKFISELENRDMTPILDAVNAIQETPWKVNTEMVEALEYVFQHEIPVKGIPLANPEPFPPKPHYWNEPGYEEESNEYKYQCFMIRERNRRAVSKRLSVIRAITLAKKYSQFPAIYFPHDLDSRGRAYPRPSFLNPQGTDYSKAMIEFAEGKPIETEEHAAYLAVAVANAWGQDKLPLQERVDWVNDNEEMLLSVAQNWRDDLRWTHADEPFMALRGALEWAALAAYGPGFMSHMPVHFDATCSGLQHFSAILRDAEGGHHVNLTASEERQDIYGAVARKTEASIRELVDDPEVGGYARAALEIGITRSLCKRPVMIVPYSGTFKAAMNYVWDYYRDLDVEHPFPEREMVEKFSPFVAKHVWSAIASTVIAATEAMEWITKTCRVVVLNDRETPIEWETPDGFICKQATYDFSPVTVKTTLDGQKVIYTQLFRETKKLDTRQMAQSLSPNFIHSLDATHLRMSILRGLDIGITNYAMIHDSFGVHASEMPRFVEECIKPAFIEMYEAGDTLAKFRKELLVNMEDTSDIPELPAMGALDIHEVQRSEFFFS